ncbi:MAG: hypothetical protein AAGM67_20165, partial [Bacteroidota bacterium]
SKNDSISSRRTLVSERNVGIPDLLVNAACRGEGGEVKLSEGGRGEKEADRKEKKTIHRKWIDFLKKRKIYPRVSICATGQAINAKSSLMSASF